MSFFPHIIQGPIPRFDRLAPQLVEGHRFEYKRVTFGIQLILFGLLQKLVLADRLWIFVASVFDDYQNQYGIITLAAIFFYAIQLYMDFSGIMDIGLGISEIVDANNFLKFKKVIDFGHSILKVFPGSISIIIFTRFSDIFVIFILFIFFIYNNNLFYSI